MSTDRLTTHKHVERSFYTQRCTFGHVRLFATPWTVVYQAPLCMGFSRQECWSGLPFPSPGDLPDPGIEPGSPALQVDFFYHLSHQGKSLHSCLTLCNPVDCSLPGSSVCWIFPTLSDPMDCSLPGSSVHGIFQAIVLEWIAISFSRRSSQPRD